ncbi:MAG: hypothetical protein ABI847_17660, partial [Anaerolineales bacterium]
SLATQAGSAATATQAGDSSEVTAAPTAASGASATEAGAPSGDPLDIIGQAERAQLNAPQYIRHTVGTDGDSHYEITIEYIAPDYLHEIVGDNEFVYIKDGGTWRRANGGDWTATSSDGSAQVFAALDPATIDELLASVDINQVKFLGPELLDGRPTWVYQFVTHTDIGNGKVLEATSKLWVGVADGLPYRSESDNPSVLTEGATGHSETTVDYTTEIVRLQPNP